MRLEVLIPSSRAFVMPSWAWGLVYSGQLLARSAAEYSAWETQRRTLVPDEDRWPLPAPLRSELEVSWRRLFSRRLPEQPWEGYSELFGIDYEGLEAVSEELRADEVAKVTEFVGASAFVAWIESVQNRLVGWPRSATMKEAARSTPPFDASLD